LIGGRRPWMRSGGGANRLPLALRAMDVHPDNVDAVIDCWRGA
jgi:hypothetical protein